MYGKTDHPLYHVWAQMVRRCYSETYRDYKHYGARGITVCNQWRNNWARFVVDMGPRPDGYTLERIDNDGNYEPSNCKWATILDQRRNTRANKNLTFKGETKTMSEWCQILNLNYSTIAARLGKLKWSTERALSTPTGTP